MTTASRVVERHLAGVEFPVPRDVSEAVEFGSLEPEAISLWKIIANSRGARPLSYGAVYTYWVNRCQEEGIELPGPLQKNLTRGFWQIQPTDDVKTWLRQSFRSLDLLSEAAKAAKGWSAEGVPELVLQLDRYPQAQSWAVEFEQDFQFALLVILKDLDQVGVQDDPEALKGWTSDLRRDTLKLKRVLDRANALGQHGLLARSVRLAA